MAVQEIGDGTFTGGLLMSFEKPVPRLARPPSDNISVTAAQLAAGEMAFMQNRRNLDDLFDHFESDRQAFIRAIYRAMVRAA